MIDEKIIASSTTELSEETKEEVAETITTALVTADPSSLDTEALTIINQLITEQDAAKQKDLTYLFNQNQNKKTMVRINKQSELLDILTDQTIKRVKDRPDELSNDDLNKLMKTVSDLIDRGRNQIIGAEQEAPFIQVNQQNNEINMDGQSKLNRESRDRVKNAVLSLLNEISANNIDAKDVIEAVGEPKND